MKICFITSTVFNLGGVQRVASVIASKLSEEHDVSIVCLSDEFPVDRAIYNLDKRVKVEIKTTLLSKKSFTRLIGRIGREINNKTNLLNKKDMVSLTVNFYYPKQIQNRFIDYINSREFDIVVGVEGVYSILLGVISDKLKAKTIGWQHNSYDAYLKNPFRYYWHQDEIFNKYIPKLDKYIVLNEYDKEMFKKNNNIDCHVISNPRSFDSDIKSDVKSNNFFAAGRFEYQKGFDLLIEAFQIFSTKNSEWNLTIVGEGKEKDTINNLIMKYNLNDRIKIEPFTKNIKKYFLNSSALLLSSRWEGMPMIVLEALEMGVPTIAYDITAVKPLITDGQQGLIVEKYDVSFYANAMLSIANNYELRREMGLKSSAKSEEFSIENIKNNWNKIINELF
ncbi:glycosyltransferase [Inconstantimicrobium mannanitabidum]|uniref:Glycosyl transferase n=1 Tax=Inconstantimicrobium mannanitabidum TaxID=1604901 RepID=A0ACB5RFF5_9CLOT|nr:glycosyltransferase [Clostridium sp. TW13]GKX67812.1 glycosyl transferase [Clostridium sp. TW13]